MSDYPAETVSALLAEGADDAPAIGAPGRQWLSYDGLRALARRMVANLNAMGIGRGDRVALVLPNGPEAASAFVAIACGATTAPLNPAYKADEFAFYLSDLNARALVVQAGTDSPARQVAARLGIPVIELVPKADGPAGGFTLRRRRGTCPAPRRNLERPWPRMWRWCCTLQAPPRGPRSCHCSTAT